MVYPPSLQPLAVLRYGYLGVTFFFVLSGFVLVWSARDDDTARGFYRRRFARVWPLHALTFCLAAGLAAAGLVDVYGPAWAAPINLALLQAWVPDSEVILSFNDVSWSLSAEAFFYAVFPVLVILGRRRGWPVMLVAGVIWLVVGGVLAQALGSPGYVSTFPAYRVGEFVVGMALGLAARRATPARQALVPTSLASASVAVSFVALLAFNRFSGGWFADHAWAATLVMLPSVALVVMAFAARDAAGREGLLTHPVMVRLGLWSFALYMVHNIVLRLARPWTSEHGWTVFIAIAVAVALSGLLYEAFERPVEKRLRGRARPAVQLEPAGK
ncbi:acyltransferase [Nocardioides KLBMP 9356]|uniref:Acyltransferase n=2 Tax=Nocardioides potassii TaxID=2911371 RepID=A0ABS9H8U7_9ACTN|nr:acyltransferase [Nocardioides potassii]